MAGSSLTPQQNENLRAAVRRLMEERDLTQAAVGTKVGMSQSNVATFLSGRSGSSFPVAQRVAELLGVDLMAMLEGTAATAQSGLRELGAGNPQAHSIALAREFAIDNGVPREFAERFDLTHLKAGRSSEQIYQVIRGAWIATDGEATGIAPEPQRKPARKR